jgi:hypothetical protein
LLQVLYNNFAMTHRVASTDSVIKGSHLGGTGKSMVKTISAMQMEQAEKLTTEEIEQVGTGGGVLSLYPDIYYPGGVHALPYPPKR